MKKKEYDQMVKRAEKKAMNTMMKIVGKYLKEEKEKKDN